MIKALNTTEFLFGIYQDSLPSGEKDDTTEVFISTFDRALIGLHTRMFLGRLVFIRDRDKKLREEISHVHAFVDKYDDMAIERQISSEKEEMLVAESSKDKYVYLDELIKTTKDTAELRNQMLNIFLPARDSTSSVTGFYLLSFGTTPRSLDEVTTGSYQYRRRDHNVRSVKVNEVS